MAGTSTGSTRAHSHSYTTEQDRVNERRTRTVVVLTLVMMAAEIFAGWRFGSMALLADGWHMGTHAGALGIAVFAYYYSRRHADSPRYSFGTGKVGVLGGYTSAIVLMLVALVMVVESIQRLLNPTTIHFNQAIVVAIIGLVVNLVSARILGGEHSHGIGGREHGAHAGHHDHDHGHEHEHEHEHDHGHDHAAHDHNNPARKKTAQDHNLRAAYLHVLADALTSLLAIFALFAGKLFGWVFMDAVMGIVGSLVIARWSLGLLRDTIRILLDGGTDPELREEIRARLEADNQTRVADLHLWHLDGNRMAGAVSIESPANLTADHYKRLLCEFDDIVHLTVEVNPLDGS